MFNIDLWGSGVGDSHRLRGLNIWSIYCSSFVPSSICLHASSGGLQPNSFLFLVVMASTLAAIASASSV